MTFSIRSAMTAVTFLAIYLAAFFSRSEIFIASVTVLMYGIVLLALPLAITLNTRGRREFWMGFFVLSFGTLIFSSYIDSYDRIATEIVCSLQRTDQATTNSIRGFGLIQPYYPDMDFSAGQTVSLPPPPVPIPNGGFSPLDVSNPWLATNNYEELFALKGLVIILLALLSGLIGGFVTTSVARRSIALRDVE